jgi:hypothetical protein
MSRETRGHVSRRRCALVWVAVTLALTGLARSVLQTVLSVPDVLRSGDTEHGIVALASALLLACGARAWLVTTATVVEACARGGCVTTGRGTPRRLVLAACGVAVLAGAASPATAGGGQPPETTAAGVLAGLSLPDRATPGRPSPAPRAAAEQPPADRSPERGPAQVVVLPGDSLWSITARSLPPDATDTDVDAAWRVLYAANRDRIGTDPGLIHPGVLLELPPTSDPSTDQQ